MRGVINDFSSLEGMKHIALVLDGHLTQDFVESVNYSERSINDVRLASPLEVWSQYHDFEFWSQLLINAYWPNLRPPNICTIRPRQNTMRSGTLILTGEIASGKTTLATALRDQFGFSVISTRNCVSDLIGFPDFKSGLREQFQKRALRFIKSPNGPQRLAESISQEVARATNPVVIDGIRHSKTLSYLRDYIPDAVVIYIDTPRDKAFQIYRNSLQRDVTLKEFRTVRHHPVEEQVVSLRHHADVYIFNGGSIKELLRLFTDWWR